MIFLESEFPKQGNNGTKRSINEMEDHIHIALGHVHSSRRDDIVDYELVHHSLDSLHGDAYRSKYNFNTFLVTHVNIS